MAPATKIRIYMHHVQSIIEAACMTHACVSANKASFIFIVVRVYTYAVGQYACHNCMLVVTHATQQ